MNDRDIYMNAPEGASPEEMAAYLDAACGDDAELRACVEALIEAGERALELAPDRAEAHAAAGFAAWIQESRGARGAIVDIRDNVIHKVLIKPDRVNNQV